MRATVCERLRITFTSSSRRQTRNTSRTECRGSPFESPTTSRIWNDGHGDRSHRRRYRCHRRGQTGSIRTWPSSRQASAKKCRTTRAVWCRCSELRRLSSRTTSTRTGCHSGPTSLLAAFADEIHACAPRTRVVIPRHFDPVAL